MSLRRFAALVGNLPPGNPLDRARHGVWTDRELLLWQTESRLRELIAVTYNANRSKGVQPIEVTYLPRPLPPDEVEREAAQQAYDDLMQEQLEAL